MNIFLDKASRDVYVGVHVKKSRWSGWWRELSPVGKSRGKPLRLSRIYSSQVEKMSQQRPLHPRAMARRCPRGCQPPWAEQGFPRASPLIPPSPQTHQHPAPRLLPG